LPMAKSLKGDSWGSPRRKDLELAAMGISETQTRLTVNCSSLLEGGEVKNGNAGSSKPGKAK